LEFGASAAYAIFRKTTQVRAASDMFIFLEEAPNSINDGFFCFFSGSDPNSGTWSDWPATYHGKNSTGISYADGHSEIHHWRDVKW